MKREDFIKQEIKSQGYNLKDFAAKIGMPYTTLLSIVNKSVGGASLDNVIKICNGLNINIEMLNPYSTDKSDDNVAISLYKRLNPLGQEKANDYINDLLDNKKYTTTETISNDIVDELTRTAKNANIPTK